MAITGVNNYNSVYENTYASSRKEAAKKEETKETAAAQKSTETAKKNGKSNNATEYANGLAKLVPSAEFRIGDGFSTAKTGTTLTVSPKLLEKMQNDPETEKEMKELIKGVEAKNKLAEKWNKMTGRTTVFRHDWIDANGQFHSFSQTIRKDELNEKLRKEAQENAEKRIEKSREKVRENAEQLAVKVSISREGIESYRKQTREKGISGRVVAKGNKESVIRQAKQATSALSANAYGGELAGEMEKLKGQRTGSAYAIADQMEDSVRAYGNLYDEIVQGYQDGTRERYAEDGNSETGFRKMTMEEELSRLDRAFQKMADRADAKEMIEGEFKRLRTEGGKGLSTNASKKPQGTDGDAPETAGQKMKRLAQEWRDAYKTSGSKESGMEKVLSMLNGMFGIRKEA